MWWLLNVVARLEASSDFGAFLADFGGAFIAGLVTAMTGGTMCGGEGRLGWWRKSIHVTLV